MNCEMQEPVTGVEQLGPKLHRRSSKRNRLPSSRNARDAKSRSPKRQRSAAHGTPASRATSARAAAKKRRSTAARVASPRGTRSDRMTAERKKRKKSDCGTSPKRGQHPGSANAWRRNRTLDRLSIEVENKQSPGKAHRHCDGCANGLMDVSNTVDTLHPFQHRNVGANGLNSQANYALRRPLTHSPRHRGAVENNLIGVSSTVDTLLQMVKPKVLDDTISGILDSEGSSDDEDCWERVPRDIALAEGMWNLIRPAQFEPFRDWM